MVDSLKGRGMKTVVIVVVAVVVLGGGAFLLLGNNKNDKTSNTATPPTSSSASSQSSPDQSASSALPMNADGTSAVSVTANDTSASPESLTVKKGAKVTITFSVSEQGTYHGGLDFKNTDDGLDSGSIAPGQSGKLSFTADKSFDLTPYWYQSGVKKDYLVSVHVQ